MRRASFEVRPLAVVSTSAFFSPFSVMCLLSLPLMPYLLGFARDCMISTASDISISPSQFASPYFMSAGVGAVDEAVVAEVVEEVVLAVVVAVVVVVVTTEDSSDLKTYLKNV